MKRVKSFSILGIIFVAVLVLLMPCWANVNNSTKAVVAQSNECFQIEVFGRSGSKIEIVEPVDYKHQTIQTNLKAFRFYWKDVERFVFRVNPETYSPTPDEQDSYTMTISIEFLIRQILSPLTTTTFLQEQALVILTELQIFHPNLILMKVSPQ